MSDTSPDEFRLVFDGRIDTTRLHKILGGAVCLLPDGAALRYRAFRKRLPVYAVQLDRAFEVRDEANQRGRSALAAKGDWLVLGNRGEFYVMSHYQFTQLYEEGEP